MPSETEQRICDLVAATLGVDAASIDLGSSSENVEPWDSVSQLSIMLAIESEFGKRPPIEKIAELASVRGLAQFLAE